MHHWFNTRRACLCLLALIAAPQAVSGQRSQPFTQSVGDFVPPPESLQAMWDASPVVIKGKVRSKAAAASSSKEHPQALRHLTVSVTHVFRDDGTVGTQPNVMVTQIGGVTMRNAQQITSRAEMRLLAPGEEVILFLQHWKAEGTLVIAYGPPGAFWVDTAAGTVEVPSALRSWAMFGGRSVVPVATLETELNSLRAKGAGR